MTSYIVTYLDCLSLLEKLSGHENSLDVSRQVISSDDDRQTA
jgi:hypothetical protein